MKRIKNATPDPILHLRTGLSFPSGVYLTLEESDMARLADAQTLSLLVAGELIFNNGADDQADPVLAWSSLTSAPRLLPIDNLNNRLRVSIAPDTHGSTHQKNGSDEINVTGLSGVLAAPQHPIASEVIAALGPKANTNPYNHDRYNQSEIFSLPESQLTLFFPTHSSANDPTSDQKAALNAALSPSTSNPFLTKNRGDDLYSSISHGHLTLPTQSEKDALSAALSPSGINPYQTRSASDGLYALLGHTHLTLPSLDQKQALDASVSPSTANPLLSVSAGDLRYALTGHTHTTLPTTGQKSALDAAQSPSTSNRFVTLSDLNDDLLPVLVNASALLARVGDDAGKIAKVLGDETISSVLWEAGWYEKVTSGGFNGSTWKFHSTMENHTHTWAQVSKSGSVLTDIADIPAKVSDGQRYELSHLNGTISWSIANAHTHLWTDVSKSGGKVSDLDVPAYPSSGARQYLSELNNVLTWQPFTHAHAWTEISRVGSKLVDMSDVPAYPASNGRIYALYMQNNVFTWIDVTSSATPKRSVMVQLNFSGTATDNFLSFGDSGVSGTATSWVPPFDCRIREVSWAMLRPGNALDTYELRAHYQPIGTIGAIVTTDLSQWFITNKDTDMLYNIESGRKFARDLTALTGFQLLRSRQYGFRIRRSAGSGATLEDVVVTMVIEEI